MYENYEQFRRVLSSTRNIGFHFENCKTKSISFVYQWYTSTQITFRLHVPCNDFLLFYASFRTGVVLLKVSTRVFKFHCMFYFKKNFFISPWSDIVHELQPNLLNKLETHACLKKMCLPGNVICITFIQWTNWQQQLRPNLEPNCDNLPFPTCINKQKRDLQVQKSNRRCNK